MLGQHEVEVFIGSNVKYYESLGYVIPKYKNKKGKLSVPKNTKIVVKVEHVPKKTQAVRIKVICDYCGCIYYTTVANYHDGHKKIQKDACKKCGNKKLQEIFLLEYGTTSIKIRSEIQGFKLGRKKKDGQIVYNDFVKKGVIPQFKPEDYNSAFQDLPYLCLKHKEKGILFRTYDSIRDVECACKFCNIENRNNEKRYAFDFVKSIFDQKNYLLVSQEYSHCDEKLDYICLKHQEYGIQSDTFFQVLNYEDNCDLCKYEKLSGENHWNWQGGISSEREQLKITKEYRDWRQSVFERDQYTCQCCGSYGGYLEAHHINSYAEYPDLRIDINNGITLCDRCHSINFKGSFHNVYTQYNNTPEQLWEYIQRFKNGEFDNLRILNY